MMPDKPSIKFRYSPEENLLFLQALNAPAEAVIRYDINATAPRLLCTQGEYLAPIQAPAGSEIRFRLFNGKRGISETQSFTIPGEKEEIPGTLIPCTQNKDFPIYNWAERHAAVLRLSKEIKPNLLFLGDSITHFWGGEPIDSPTHDILQRSPESWMSMTAGYHALNLGFGFDQLENVLWRIQHGELDNATNDAICVILVGTNNLANGNTDEEILLGLTAICDEIRRKLPQSTIVLQGFYPRNNLNRGTPEHIRSLNEQVSQLAQKHQYIFTNPGLQIADKDGFVPAEYSEDGLHPSTLGYERLANVLIPLIQSLRKN